MSNKSGIAGEIISLPTGGGALQGIGDKFSGGRNGFQPQLNLVYSIGQGDSPFGLGWSLSEPGVSRKTSRGVPRYRDQSSDAADHDTFILSDAEDLVPVSGGGQERQRYRPRTEALFARIECHRHAGDDLWEVPSKDGLSASMGPRISRQRPLPRRKPPEGKWELAFPESARFPFKDEEQFEDILFVITYRGRTYPGRTPTWSL